MIIFRKDTTFPFLKIAREGGVPYGRVVRLAEEIRLWPISETKALADRNPLVAKIVKAMDAEAARRAEVGRG